MSRRKFIKTSALGLGGILLAKCASGTDNEIPIKKEEKILPVTKPIVISTWNHGIDANKAAWEILEKGGNALDAVEAGVRVTESDADNRSVGLGGLPDREGKVTLDACIMNHENECGAVAFLQDIEHP
ncbi:MAG: isoaspartyl peptidase/L-asparaginase, partial [Vicingaceae bacterium]